MPDEPYFCHKKRFSCHKTKLQSFIIQKQKRKRQDTAEHAKDNRAFSTGARIMDIEQFNHNIVAMRDELVAMATRLSGNSETAEDLVQEVMLKLWDMRTKLDSHTCHKALALTILRNKFYDRQKHARYETTAGLYGTDQGKEDTTVETADELGVIRKIMESLPPLQAQILRMKEIEGYDKEEIIKITGCTPESLRQNLSRARKRIREEFMRITTYNSMRRG